MMSSASKKSVAAAFENCFQFPVGPTDHVEELAPSQITRSLPDTLKAMAVPVSTSEPIVWPTWASVNPESPGVRPE
jgi:hypothetical protein